MLRWLRQYCHIGYLGGARKAVTAIVGHVIRGGCGPNFLDITLQILVLVAPAKTVVPDSGGVKPPTFSNLHSRE